MSELIDDERLRSQLIERSLKETGELLAFLSVLVRKLDESLEDSKVSIPELINLTVSVVAHARQALVGLLSVPNELKHVVDSPENIELLADVIMPDLTEYASPFAREFASALVGLLRELVNTLSIYRNRSNWVNPPKPRVVP